MEQQNIADGKKCGKKMEMAVVAESECGRVILAEVKKRKERTNLRMVKNLVTIQLKKMAAIQSALGLAVQPLP